MRPRDLKIHANFPTPRHQNHKDLPEVHDHDRNNHWKGYQSIQWRPWNQAVFTWFRWTKNQSARRKNHSISQGISRTCSKKEGLVESSVTDCWSMSPSNITSNTASKSNWRWPGAQTRRNSDCLWCHFTGKCCCVPLRPCRRPMRMYSVSPTVIRNSQLTVSFCQSPRYLCHVIKSPDDRLGECVMILVINNF